MDLSIESALTGGALVGHVSYALLILSMLMTRMLWLRAFAIGSGLVALAYEGFWRHDPVGLFWISAFILINVAQIAILEYRNRAARFSPEERAFHSMAVPTLEPAKARDLLRHGRLREAQSGTVLVHEGEPVAELIFLLDGNVHIKIGENRIADCGQGHFIGEIGVSTGGPASATAVVSQPARFLAFDGATIRQMLDKGDEISQAVETAFRHGFREKLLRANAALAESDVSTPVRRP